MRDICTDGLECLGQAGEGRAALRPLQVKRRPRTRAAAWMPPPLIAGGIRALDTHTRRRTQGKHATSVAQCRAAYSARRERLEAVSPVLSQPADTACNRRAEDSHCVLQPGARGVPWPTWGPFARRGAACSMQACGAACRSPMLASGHRSSLPMRGLILPSAIYANARWRPGRPFRPRRPRCGCTAAAG